jgi:RNA polymerase sigma-70 factor (ECF subfamily)
MSDTATAPRQFAELEEHRVELTGYCYRMLGSAFDAQDAVQETLVRAWRSLDRFEGRSTLRSWLYRIATNVCFDSLNGKQRRAMPMDLGPSSTADAVLTEGLPEATWLEPVPDGLVISPTADPADRAVTRESIRLAFVAALQFLPPRQRAVLILRDVLRLSAAEVAELLDTSVASVNSAMQRARATLDARAGDEVHPYEAMDEQHQRLLDRYVEAFESYDIDAFVSLLHDDVVQSMPPYELWLRGPVEMGRWMLGPGIGCRGSRLVPTIANGRPAFGQYRPSGPNGSFEPWSIHVVEISEGRVAGITFFLDTARYFPLFGLPETLP